MPTIMQYMSERDAFIGPEEQGSYNGFAFASFRQDRRLIDARDVVGLREQSKRALATGASSHAKHLEEMARIFTWPTDTGAIHGPANVVYVPPVDARSPWQRTWAEEHPHIIGRPLGE
jgi:hypothetical protein